MNYGSDKSKLQGSFYLRLLGQVKKERGIKDYQVVKKAFWMLGQFLSFFDSYKFDNSQNQRAKFLSNYCSQEKERENEKENEKDNNSCKMLNQKSQFNYSFADEKLTLTMNLAENRLLKLTFQQEEEGLYRRLTIAIVSDKEDERALFKMKFFIYELNNCSNLARQKV